MKTTRLVTKLLVAAAATGLGIAGAHAADSKDGQVNRARNSVTPRERVVLVQVTGSWIPQRVVIAGNQVNSASNVVFYGRNDLYRTGASDVGAALASVDPDIMVRRSR
jgi:hypothetical protein